MLASEIMYQSRCRVRGIHVRYFGISGGVVICLIHLFMIVVGTGSEDSDCITLRPSCVIPLRDEVQQMFEADWLCEVQREKKQDGRGTGLNKLRTYARLA